MKALLIFALALVSAGCSIIGKSKYANDPRAASVGPDFLDYIDQHPRDKDTQYYYPLFSVRGLTNEVDFSVPMSAAESEFKPLLITIPQPTEAVQAITGKGWPILVRTGDGRTTGLGSLFWP